MHKRPLNLSQHKVAIGKVQGANAPEVAMLVRENVFPPKPKDE